MPQPARHRAAALLAGIKTSHEGLVGQTPRFAGFHGDGVAAVGLITAGLVARSFGGRTTSFPCGYTHSLWVGLIHDEWGILLRGSFCEIRLT